MTFLLIFILAFAGFLVILGIIQNAVRVVGSGVILIILYLVLKLTL